MRKIVATALLMLSVNFLIGQSAKVLNAYNYLKDGELSKAVMEIEPAIEHDKTKGDGKTWYYRGQIFEQIYFAEDEAYADLKEGSLMKAVESFAKAKELGSKRINMNDVNDRYQRLGAFCYQEGVNQFNNKNFETALSYFEKCYSVRQEAGVIDSGAVYSAGVSAMSANKNEVAVKNFRESIRIGYSVEDCYVNIANIYKAQGDKEKHKAIMKEARQALPNSQEIITAEINIYLESKEYDKALENLNVAIENDPDNALLWFVRGNIYDSKQANMLKDGKKEESVQFFEKAKADYLKAIEIDENYFDAAYSIGALYFNRGAEMLNEANMISDDAAYKKAKEKADAQLKDALPFLEKAHALQPEDVSTMTSLKELYARTNQMEKYKEMSEKLSN
ncbi:MAG: tetratricopeptide repeat protein [Salibacteraceae bacterium]